MHSATPRTRKVLLVAALLGGTIALGGCATEDYVDKHIATVNARIDQTDSRLGALEGRVNEVSQKADAAGAAAQAANSAAQAAGTAAQSAAADAQRANQGVDELKPLVAHLEMHHKYQTWRDVHPIHKKKMAAKRAKHKASNKAKAKT
jgi:outer membrane murein-binding lipoprotein Lpp